MSQQRRAGLYALVYIVVFLVAHASISYAQKTSKVKELTYTWRGYTIYYKTAGKLPRGTKEMEPPVIFLHGFGASSFTWRHNLPEAAKEHKVVAPDLLGFGKSHKPEIAYSPEVWVNLLHEFTMGNDYSRVTLIGNGMGGLVAAEFALKYPDMVHKLVLEDSIGLSYEMPRIQQLFTTPVIGEPALRLLLRRSNVARILKRGIYADPDKVTVEVAEGYFRPFLSPGAVHAYRYVGKKIRQWKLGERLKEISAPTLIVWGEEDTLTSVENAVEMDASIPDSKVVTIPGTGHCPHEESPERFNDYIMRFLRGSGPVSSTAPQ